MNSNVSKKKDKTPSVFSLSKPSRCYNCDQRQAAGALVTLRRQEEESEILCRDCSGLSAFVVLVSGNAQATRLASKHSPRRHVILRWSELWKTYERLGLLIEAAAAEVIEKELGIKL